MNVYPPATVVQSVSVPSREYHERTKHSPESVRADARRLDWANRPIPYKVYEGLPSVPLADAVRPSPVPALRAIADPGGPAVGGPRTPPATNATPDLDAVTQLCWLSAGITRVLGTGDRERAFRAAACTGALYHVDAYLVAGELRGGDSTADSGLASGVYHFDPRDLTLDVLREGDFRGVLAEATGGHHCVGEAPLSVVLTSTWWRNAWKYGERTYRHAFWDSGTVLANLLALAHGLDLPASVVAGFADATVANLLGVDPREEGPVAVVPVGSGAPAPDPIDVEPIDPATEPLSPDPIEYGLIGDAYEASSLADGEAVRAWRESAAWGDPESGVSLVSRAPGDGERIPLDPVDDARAAKTPLHGAIRRRGSCREYAREPLSFRKVSTVLDRATRGVPMDANGGDDADPPAPLALNDCYLVVSGVEGVEPGAYQYLPGEGALERLRAGDFRTEAGHLALDQRLAADAALCAFFLTDLDAVTDALGDRGYRAAQLEAAVTAGRLYLAAYAHRDLGATGLTFYDDAVTEFFSPRAAGQTPTFLWTLGRPA